MSDKLTSWSKSQNASAKKATEAWQKFFGTRGDDAIDRAEEIHATAKIADAQDKNESELLALPNVVGVAASLKVKAGKPTRKWCMSVYVEKKKAQISSRAKVPREIDGVPTDIVEVGRLQPLAFDSKVRPALPGYSIGHFNITAGTNGCLVRDLRGGHDDGDYLILSNNHVMANSNQASEGDLILQPGPFDGGVYPSDGIATLERFEPIVFGASGYNLVDAAVARPLESRNVTASIIGNVIPRGVDQAFIGGQVIKAGRTTEVTTGFVTAVNATVVVGGFPGGAAQFRHQIMTTGMSAGGDSGSLLMDSSLNAVGLLFAGSFFVTIHNHIADVESALGVRPMTAPRFA